MNKTSNGWDPRWWSNPTKSGILCKQGHFVKNWKNRHFILQGDKLFYFKQKGVIHKFIKIKPIIFFSQFLFNKSNTLLLKIYRIKNHKDA